MKQIERYAVHFAQAIDEIVRSLPKHQRRDYRDILYMLIEKHQFKQRKRGEPNQNIFAGLEGEGFEFNPLNPEHMAKYFIETGTLFYNHVTAGNFQKRLLEELEYLEALKD